MRPQLLVSGILVMLLGAMFYLLQIPLVYYWSLPFLAGGALMAAASLFVSESPGPLRPPEGYVFCRFCSGLVPVKAERCPTCNGLQGGGGG